MVDNIKLIEQNVEVVLDENGAPGSILALEHKGFVKEMLKKVGKYSGWFYTAKKNSTANISGVMNFNGNAFNNTSNWILTVAKLTADLNDIGETLIGLAKGDIIHFKDYVGRSVFLKFQSYEASQDAGLNDVYNITVQGISTNINYTYQDNESEIGSLSFQILQDNKFKAVNLGTVQINANGSIPIADAINNLPDNGSDYKTIDNNEVPIFVGVAIPVQRRRPSYQFVYVALGYGHGIYGVNGNIILTDADVYPIELKQTDPNIPTVSNDPNALVFDLGEIPSGDFLAVINSEPDPYYDLTNPDINYYFEFTVGGARVLYGFDGTLGVYGDGQLQMVNDDVFLVYDERSPSIFPYDITGITDGQVVKWNATTMQFEPADDGGGSGERRRKVTSIVDNTSAPPTEVLGDRYILDFTGGGVHADWDGASAGDIVEFDGTVWVAETPIEGWVTYVDDVDSDYRYVDDGSPTWEEIVVGMNNLSVRNTNDIEQFTTQNQILFQGAEFDVPNKKVIISPLQANTVYVSNTGDDATAEVTNPNRPFLNFHTAMAQLPTDGSFWTIVLLSSTINVTRRFNMNTNMKFISFLSGGSILNFDNVFEDDGTTPAEFVFKNRTSSTVEFENVGLTCTTSEIRYWSDQSVGIYSTFKYSGTLNYLKWNSSADGGINQGKFPLSVSGTDLTVKQLIADQSNSTGECIFVSRNNTPTIKLTIESIDIRSSFAGITHYPNNYDFTLNNIIQNNLGSAINWNFFGIGETPSFIKIDGNLLINGTATIRATTLDLNILSSNSTSKLNCDRVANITGFVNTAYEVVTIVSFGGTKTLRDFIGWIDTTLDDYGIGISSGGKLILDNAYVKLNKALAHMNITGADPIIPAQDSIVIRGVVNIQQVNSGDLFRDRRFPSRPIAPINVIIVGEIYFNGIIWGSYVTLIKISWSSIEKTKELKITHKYQLINRVLDLNTTYLIDGTITLSTDEYIEVPAGGNLTINGYGLEASKISKNVSGQSIFSSPVGGSGGLQLDSIKFDSGLGSVFDLVDATGFNAIEAVKVNFENCASLGELDGYRQALWSNIGLFGNSDGLTFSGTWLGGFTSDKIISRNLSGTTGVIFKTGTSLVFNSRFVTDANLDIPSGWAVSDFATGNFASNDLLQIQGAIISRAGVFDDTDTGYFPNIDEEDSKSRWVNNIGIQNSSVTFIKLKSPDNTVWKVEIDNSGNLTTTAI